MSLMRLASLAPRNGFLSLVRCKLRLADGVATPAEVQDYQRILNVLRSKFRAGSLSPENARRFGIE
jgi:hypothetical protein